MGYGFMDSSSNPSYKGIFYVIGSKYKDLVLDKNLEPGFFTADCRLAIPLDMMMNIQEMELPRYSSSLNL